MPFQDAIHFKRFYYVFPSGIVPCLYLSFLKYDSAENNSAQKLKRRKASRIILSLWKASSAAMLEMWELVPFTEAKCRVLPLWSWLLALQKPRGPGAQSSAYLHESSSSVDAKPPMWAAMQSPTAQHKAGGKNLNQQQQKHPNPLPIQFHHPYNLSTLPDPE